MRAEEDSTENGEEKVKTVKLLRRCLTRRLWQLVIVMLPKWWGFYRKWWRKSRNSWYYELFWWVWVLLVDNPRHPIGHSSKYRTSWYFRLDFNDDRESKIEIQFQIFLFCFNLSLHQELAPEMPRLPPVHLHHLRPQHLRGLRRGWVYQNPFRNLLKMESLSRFYWCIFCLAKVQSEGGLQNTLTKPTFKLLKFSAE